ncbi:GLPGLI family protein [Paenimyroides aestuarii]|uniref:GLPGLI family protein n=1 Tax=Paenimyroides aestuarii TaxID=2968490 RepID=A0ABY5NR98_9FLAO|nr:GLPGLI family protein [Paenimyroides aestuarii]UUV20983.1 GLPGLI family protein [Paenimyroides aestuarii]
MKNIILTLVWFYCHATNAQHLKITYKQFQTYDYTSVIDTYLYINTKENKSILVQDYKSQKELDEKINDIAHADAYATLDRSIPYDFIFLDLTKKSISMYEDFARKIYMVDDVFPEISWQLIDEQKTINDIKVNKAIGTYRGNTWYVWYAPSIPYSFGPWKLNGLPGLILEAKDIAGNIVFNVEKIQYNVICNDCTPPGNNLHKITLKEYLILQDNFTNNLEADLPRGTTVSYTKKSILTKELKFEFPIKFLWEEEPKKQ